MAGGTRSKVSLKEPITQVLSQLHNLAHPRSRALLAIANGVYGVSKMLNCLYSDPFSLSLVSPVVNYHLDPLFSLPFNLFRLPSLPPKQLPRWVDNFRQVIKHESDDTFKQKNSYGISVSRKSALKFVDKYVEGPNQVCW